jgi:hypothetical protein
MIQVNQAYSFAVTFDRDDLAFVAAKIYDDSGVTPVLLATVPMTQYANNTYKGKYTFTSPGPILIQKSVYTNNSYDILDDNYSEGDETQQVVDLSTGVTLNNGNSQRIKISLKQSQKLSILIKALIGVKVGIKSPGKLSVKIKQEED